MYKGMMYVFILSLCVGLFVGCSQEEARDLPPSVSEKELYHDFGEAFLIDEDHVGEPVEITVHDTWMEEGEEHDAFIDAFELADEDRKTVSFVEFSVTNKGESAFAVQEIIPLYWDTGVTGSGFDMFDYYIDLTYPENDGIKEDEDLSKWMLEPGETYEFTGAVPTSTYSEREGAFVWIDDDYEMEVVFQTPQQEREDAIGVYDFGEEMLMRNGYVSSHWSTIIHTAAYEDDAEVPGIPMEDDATYLVLEVDIENTSDDPMQLAYLGPTIRIGEDRKHLAEGYEVKGEFLDHVYDQEDPAMLESGETFKGKIYHKIEKSTTDEVRVVYLDDTLGSFPDYQKTLDFNLE